MTQFTLTLSSYELTCVQIMAEQIAAQEARKARENFQWAKDHPTLAADAYKLAQACNKESDLWTSIAKACKGAERKEAE